MSKPRERCNPVEHSKSLADSSRTEESNAPRRLAAAAACGLLLLAVVLTFGRTIAGDFVILDDDVCVSENPWVAQGPTVSSLGWAFTNRLVGNWDPLTWISHMIDWRLFGSWAGGHHLVNVLLHAATTVLLFFVLRLMTDQLWPAALAAALWAVHPLRVESVAWITERKDVLSGLFFALTLWAYARYVRQRSIARYGLLLALLTAGLMSKPMLATVPGVLLLLDYWPLSRVKGGGGSEKQDGKFPAGLFLVLLEKLPLLLPVIACTVVTIWAQHSVEYEYGSWSWRIGNAAISYVVYLRQFFWPVDLASLYMRRPPILPLWQVWGSVALLAAISGFVWSLRRRCPYLLVGWFWYLGMLLPVVGLVPFGNQAPADRFTYLPQIGLAVAAAWTVADLCRRGFVLRRTLVAGSVLSLLVLMGASYRQTSFWRDGETHARRSLACTSQNYRAHTMLGNALARQGRTNEAVAEFQRALAIQPDFADASYNLGVAAAAQGRPDRAIFYYRKAIAASPDHANAHNNLGAALMQFGRIDEAMKHCQAALQANPELSEAYFNLGNAMFIYRRLDKAEASYRKALVIRPNYAEAWYNLGLVCEQQGRLDLAAASFRDAIRLRPNFREALASLNELERKRGVDHRTP
ncbi:MAG: tetratricopeptide repeat protein [Thermoguttaceae bacterium]